MVRKFIEIWFDIERKDQSLEVSLSLQNSWRVTVWEIENGEIDPYGEYYEVKGNMFTSFREAIQKARKEAKRLRELGYFTNVSSASSKAKYKIKTVREELYMSALPIY